jgi:glycosyltransferase involved in cell wall biosynthesis
MRVLKIIHTMGHGGAENIFRWLAWQLRQEGIDVVAGIPLNNDPSNPENWITPALEELNVPYKTFDKTGNAFDLLRNISAMIKTVQPDIVHSHLLDSNFYSSVACRWLSVPHVCTEHGDISFKGTLSDRIKFSFLSLLSDSVICVSEAVRNNAMRITPFKGKLGIVYNGIHFQKESVSNFRGEFGIPPEALLIGNIGNLYPVKGQQFLIDAFSRLLTSFPHACLVLVGRGNERDNLMNQIARFAIPDGKVILTGFRTDIGNILKSLDVYVQPSLSEGLPVSLLEALSAGVPVIATDVGGVAEVLGKNKYGLLVPPNSPDDLYEGMMEVVRNLGVFRAKSKVSQMMVRDRFSLDAMTRRYVEIYENVLKIRNNGQQNRACL